MVLSAIAVGALKLVLSKVLTMTTGPFSLLDTIL